MTPIKINKDTIFVFDLHGVIFKLSPTQVLKELLNCPFKFKLLTTLLHPKIICSTLLNLKRGAIAQETLYDLGIKFPKYKDLIPTGFKIINAQKPINETVEIIETLKNKNYKIYLLSNIGSESVDFLSNKYPSVFENFDGIWTSNLSGAYIKKPDTIAFTNFLTVFNLKPEQIIFIDDKKENIKTAQKLNIRSLLFENSSNLKIQLSSLMDKG